MKITDKEIERILGIADVNGFTGEFHELGGGEVNNTYLVETADQQLILRIAKDRGHHSLIAEAHTLELLDSPHIPQLIYFNEHETIDGHAWILESAVQGSMPSRLSVAQFKSLDSLLAEVHAVKSPSEPINLHGQFLKVCKSFGDEKYLLEHPDVKLKGLIIKLFAEFDQMQYELNAITPSLTHSDATPSNTLVDGDTVGLIDWEFSRFTDPMLDFSTIYYEDMEYNRGKWRIQITPEEKHALFNGYTQAGGELDESRIRFWIRFDKIGAAVFLYWRIHHSTRDTPEEGLEQYRLDYHAILKSLRNSKV